MELGTVEASLNPAGENSVCGTFKPLRKEIIFDCSFARRFWTGRFSVTYQSHVAGLVLQQQTVAFSCHELLFYLTTDFIFFFYPSRDQNHCMSTKFVMQLCMIQTKYGDIKTPLLPDWTIFQPSQSTNPKTGILSALMLSTSIHSWDIMWIYAL